MVICHGPAPFGPDNPSSGQLGKTSARLQFYNEVLGHFNESSFYRNIFFEMFLNDVGLVFSSGISGFGRKEITATLCNGLNAGTSFVTRNLLSGRNVTVVDLVFVNPSHSPNHCPPSGSFVFSHKEERISRVHLHYASTILGNADLIE